jgi:hypothetical protein
MARNTRPAPRANPPCAAPAPRLLRANSSESASASSSLSERRRAALQAHGAASRRNGQSPACPQPAAPPLLPWTNLSSGSERLEHQRTAAHFRARRQRADGRKTTAPSPFRTQTGEPPQSPHPLREQSCHQRCATPRLAATSTPKAKPAFRMARMGRGRAVVVQVLLVGALVGGWGNDAAADGTKTDATTMSARSSASLPPRTRARLSAAVHRGFREAAAPGVVVGVETPRASGSRRSASRTSVRRRR